MTNSRERLICPFKHVADIIADGAEVGIFQMAEVPMNMCVYTLP